MRNYLRVRGEYSKIVSDRKRVEELPPRARRIHDILAMCSKNEGTTSACAENTHVLLYMRGEFRNYLRVRGEYRKLKYDLTQAMELPPRARRIRKNRDRGVRRRGTTSACAENTSPF